MKNNNLANMVILEQAAMQLFHLSREEARDYVEKWGEIFADRLQNGWYPAFVKPGTDGSITIEFFNHEIKD